MTVSPTAQATRVAKLEWAREATASGDGAAVLLDHAGFHRVMHALAGAAVGETAISPAPPRRLY